MNELESQTSIPDDVVVSKIYFIRNTKVMLDRDLALLFGVETKRLKEAVRRNIARFPPDFMFEMSSNELSDWRSQFATSKSDKQGLRHPPFCFTEQGVTMISCVLNSERAIKVNIQIVRVFTRMLNILSTHKEILKKLEELDNKNIDQDERIDLIFSYIKQLQQEKQNELDFKNRKQIGYRT